MSFRIVMALCTVLLGACATAGPQREESPQLSWNEPPGAWVRTAPPERIVYGPLKASDAVSYRHLTLDASVDAFVFEGATATADAYADRLLAIWSDSCACSGKESFPNGYVAVVMDCTGSSGLRTRSVWIFAKPDSAPDTLIVLNGKAPDEHVSKVVNAAMKDIFTSLKLKVSHQ